MALTQISTQGIKDGTITNADIGSSAAIDVSKLSGVLPLAGGTLTGNTTISSSGNPSLSIISTTQGGVPKIQLRDGYNRDNFISIDDNGDNLIIAVDEGNNGHASTIRHRIDGVEVSRITRAQNLSLITHSLVGNVDISSGLDVTGAITATDNITITSSHPKLLLTDDTNPDFSVHVNASAFHIRNETDIRNDFRITSDGTNELYHGGNLKLKTVSGGIEVTGAITGTGDVTITKASDTAKLSLISTGGSGQQFDIRSINSNGRFAIGTASNNHVLFESSNNNVLIADNAGKVGIGTTSPAGKLHVVDVYHFLVVGGNSTTGMKIGNYDGTTYGKLTTRASELRFDIGDNNKMLIDSSGNVGIGTTTPAVKLDVNGATTIRVANSTSYQSGLNVSNSVTTDLQVWIKNNAVALGPSTASEINFVTGGNTGTRLSIAADGVATFSKNIVLEGGSSHAYPHIRLHSSAANVRKWTIYNGQSWNPDALLIYDTDGDSTALTIEPGKLGVNKGANSLTETLEVGGNASITGNLIIGTNGKGIDFSASSNNSGMSSELLDDYEEGRFTPSYTVGSGGGNMVNNATYNNPGGSYTKVGRLVHFTLRIQLNSGFTVIGGHVVINGLPFTSVNEGHGGQSGATFGYRAALGTNEVELYIGSGSTQIQFYTLNGTTFYAGAGGNNFANTLHVWGSYHAA